MTCPHSPFAAAEGRPTVPQDGQSHPDCKGEKCVCVCVCVFVCYIIWSWVLALLFLLILRRQVVSCSQTAFIQKALVWKWSVWLQETACFVCLLLGTLQLPANKTILVFIQGEDGAVSMHNNEGILCCYLAFITSLCRFPF